MTALPETTDAKIKKLMKQYGKTKWEIIVMAIDREYGEARVVRNLIAKALDNTK